MPRNITNEEKSFLMKLKQSDITLDLLKSFFAVTAKANKAKFEPNDTFELKPNEYYNKTQIVTTVGRYIVNKTLLEPKIIELIGYQNTVLSGKAIKNLDQKIIDDCLLTEKITIQDMYYYFDQCNWLAYAPTYFIVPSLDTDMFVVDKEVKDRKAQLIEENKEAIQNNDTTVIFNIEQELLKMSREKVKDIPGYFKLISLVIL